MVFGRAFKRVMLWEAAADDTRRFTESSDERLAMRLDHGMLLWEAVKMQGRIRRHFTTGGGRAGRTGSVWRCEGIRFEAL